MNLSPQSGCCSYSGTGKENIIWLSVTADRQKNRKKTAVHIPEYS
jgi:hypothetical protein